MVDKTDNQKHDFSRDITIEYHIIEASFLINNDNFFNTCTLQNDKAFQFKHIGIIIVIIW